MSEREHHIKVLEQFLHDYQEWGEDLELEKTIKYAISSLKTDETYQLMYEGEDIYTKADMMEMLEDLRLDFQEAELAGELDNKELIFADEADDLIQQKINSLKEDTNQ